MNGSGWTKRMLRLYQNDQDSKEKGTNKELGIEKVEPLTAQPSSKEKNTGKKMSTHAPIATVQFSDGTTRLVYEDAQGH